MTSQVEGTYSADDSDATVAHEDDQGADFNQQLQMLPNEDSQALESDGSMTNSPSLLYPNEARKSRELVPCSSDEGEEVLSQEYPPLNDQLPSHQIDTGDRPSVLKEIKKDQAILMSEIERVLENYGGIFPSNFVKSTKDTVTKMEERLKCVSAAHQSEKKCLVTVLSQGGSQEGGGKSEALRLQLVSLSGRQKQLLQCFIKQKEISGKLAQLAQREASAKKTVESSGSSNASTVILPNLVKHLLQLSQPLPPTHSHSCSDATSGNGPSSQVDTVPGQAGKNRMLVSLSQSSGVPSSADKTAGARSSQQQQQQQQGSGDTVTAKLLSSSELTQPVPLATLIQHNIVQPNPGVLTCTLLGCGFTGALLKDGGIEETQTPESPGAGTHPSLHQLPQQWVRSCWTRLGHCHKKISKKHAYNIIFYKNKSLSYYCEQYSRQQVSSYLSHKKSGRKLPTQHTTEHSKPQPAATDCNTVDHDTMEVESSQPHVHVHVHNNVQTLKSQPPSYGFDLNSLLAMGEVWLVSPMPRPHSSLPFPRGFWELEGDTVLSRDTTQQIEDDLNWQ